MSDAIVEFNFHTSVQIIVFRVLFKVIDTSSKRKYTWEESFLLYKTNKKCTLELGLRL